MSYIGPVEEAPCDTHPDQVYSYRWEGDEEDFSEPFVIKSCPKCIKEQDEFDYRQLRKEGLI